MEFIPVNDDEKINKVVELSETIWTEHYTPIIGPGQVRYMLDKFLTRETIKDQIANRAYSYYLFEADGEILGYLAYYINDGMFLSKLYILKKYRGKGYSRQAVNKLVEMCKADRLRKIWLQVDRKNTESIKAYLALGFRKTHASVTDIGSGYVMDDDFMALNVS